MSTEEAGALSAQVHLPPHLGSAGSARRFLSSTLRGWHVPDDVVDVVNLLATELVGNAVHHGVGGVLVTVRTQPPPALRVEVHDDGPELPVLRDAEDDAESGRGLRLIELLASRWGTLRHRDDGKDVWFELDVAATGAPA
jgi:anti-sigma regulatory factor (Ser/Thr protein kinase)